ncbi:MAG: penicillin-binding transpeptidase domain-containing protein [Cellulosilyticaceae bacterium]
MNKKPNKFFRLFADRVFLVFGGISILFIIIVGKFYQLQIIEHDKYANDLRASVERNIEIPATRGRIYDRYGRELAINQPTNVLKFDQQVRMKKGELNKILLELANVLEANGDTYSDHVPITKTPPFEYTGSKSAINQFMYSVPYNDAAHREELLRLSAEGLIAYLRSEDVFNIDASISDVDARKIIAMRLEIHPYTYRKYNLVTLATNISEKTVTQIEENHGKYPGVMVDVEPIRYYPDGEMLGNILGYTRAITESQYKELKEKGYDKNDVVGHEGIEKSMEEALRGEKGMEQVEVDNLGRRVHTIEKKDAIPGNDVYLTIDLDLQRETYASVEKRLSEALVQRLKGGKDGVEPLTSKEVVVSMVKSSQLNFNEMKEAPSSSTQRQVYDRLMKTYNEMDKVIQETMAPVDLLVQNLEENTNLFTEKEILLALHEQKRIALAKETEEAFRVNKFGTTESALMGQLEAGHLKPNQFSVDPFSASAVMLDSNTGEVLALVGYPSFDSNQMTTNFNQYYNSLFDDRSMLWNRAVMTKEAPGSTFKMITGVAGLEEGVVTPDTLIYDTGVYEKAGTPGPKCWIHSKTGGGHGNVNMIRGLEVSCNYYFFDVAYRLGLLSSEPYDGIDMLTKYAEMFGLGEPTGIEIAEAEPNISSPKNLVKNQLNSVLSGIKNGSEATIGKYKEDVKLILDKGIYPLGNGSDTSLGGKIDYLTQYELKRNIEPLLQEVFEEQMDSVLDQTFSSLQSELSTAIQQVVSEIVSQTMNDRSNKSLRLKTKDELIRQLDGLIGVALEKNIRQVIDEMDLYDILDAYEYAYDVLYNRELRKNENPDVVEELRRRLEMIDDEESFYREHLTKKVKESILQAIATNALAKLDLNWSEGTTVRTAIGQGSNAFTPVQMARYIAALANGETVYNVRLINGIYDVKEDNRYEPKMSTVYGQLDLKPTTIDVIHEGMFQVTHGSSGSARGEFKNFPIEVAGKTGTAQKGESDGKREHSWFVGFAPFDKPQIAFVTTMYYADGLGNYGRLMAQDMLTEYFGLNEEIEKITLDNMFMD